MKIELKRRIDGRYEYINVNEILGVPLLSIFAMESTKHDSCIKVTGDTGKVTIITDDMLHHVHYCNKGYKMMCMRDGLELIAKHFGKEMLCTVPGCVEEVFPGSAFIGVSNEQLEVQ